MGRRLGLVAAAVLVVAGCATGQQGRPAASGDLPTAHGAATSQGAATSLDAATSPGATASSSASVSSGVPSHAAVASPTAAGTRPIDKLLLFVVENHSLAEMRAGMPHTYDLARQFGHFDHYRAIRHPSLPNYVAIASGSTHAIADDADPAAHPLAGRSVFGTALAAGSTAAVYADGMSEPCQPTSEGSYAVKHNPWPYFAGERAQCARHDVPLQALEDDVREGRLPAAGMVVPDLCHDAHDCPLAVADDWFATWMARVMAGPDWQSGRLVVVLTADEDDRSAGNTVLSVVAHPSLHHVVVSSALTHYSLTRLYAEVTGTPPLGNAAAAPSIARAFNLPIG